MALNPTGIMSIGGPITGSSINLELGLSATANSNMNQTDFRSLAGIPSGTIALSNFYGKSNGTQKALYMYGTTSQFPSFFSISNLVSNTGVVAADTPITTPVRLGCAGSGYGGDKGIVFAGAVPPNAPTPIVNLVSNTGVVGATNPSVGSGRTTFAGCIYGGPAGTAIFLGGAAGAPAPTTTATISNRVSNTGVLAANANDMGTGRFGLCAAGYGGDKAFFYGGISGTTRLNSAQLISNTGVISGISQSIGTGRTNIMATAYGGDKAVIFGGQVPPTSNITNYVSNTGVVAANSPSVNAAREATSGVVYGGDKGIFVYGETTAGNQRTLVSNTGVFAAEAPGAGTIRRRLAASTYSFT
jgi:hypothetical protein